LLWCGGGFVVVGGVWGFLCWGGGGFFGGVGGGFGGFGGGWENVGLEFVGGMGLVGLLSGT